MKRFVFYLVIICILATFGISQQPKLQGLSVLRGIFTMDGDGGNQELILDMSGIEVAEGSVLAEINGAMYGLTESGNANDRGFIFKIDIDQTNYQVVYVFDQSILNPKGKLILVNDELWGISSQGGANGNGAIFKVGLDGTGFQIVHNFNLTDGAIPNGNLIRINDTLFGSTKEGGSNDDGTIFSIDIDGSNYQVIHNFNGSAPNDGMVFFNGKLWGTMSTGTILIFSINPDGSNYSIPQRTNTSSGSSPIGGLLISDNKLWGTTTTGGSNGLGTLFSFDPNSNGLTVAHNFATSDGTFTRSQLIEVNNTIYGLAESGGSQNKGALYKLENGTSFSVHHQSITNSNNGGIIYSQGNFWKFRTSIAGVDGIRTVPEDGSLATTAYIFSNVNGWSPSSIVNYEDKIWVETNFQPIGGPFIFRMNKDGTQTEVAQRLSISIGQNVSGMIEYSDEIFGVNYSGGSGNQGTVFKINPNTLSYQTLYHFNSGAAANPAGIIGYNGEIWGVTATGGANGFGSIFKIGLDGSGYTEIYDFDGAEGSGGSGKLAIVNNKIWGTTSEGGTMDGGVFFEFDPTTMQYSVLANLSSFSGIGEIVVVDDIAYSLERNGGDHAKGLLYKIADDGNGKIALHHFALDQSEGEFPSSLVAVGGKLYGTTIRGGTNGVGTLYSWDISANTFNIEKDYDDGVNHRLNALVAPNNIPYQTNQVAVFQEDIENVQTIEFTDFFDDFEDGSQNLTYNVESTVNETLFSTFDIQANSFSFTIPPNQFGDAQLNLRVTDSEGMGINGIVTISVEPSPDLPFVADASTVYGLQTEPMVIQRSFEDGVEVDYFKIENISNGELFKSDGTTQINEGDLITFQEGTDGVRFAPAGSGLGSFDVKASIGNLNTSLLSQGISATISVEQATLRAIARDFTIVYGEDLPTPLIDYQGFVNGDLPKELDQEPTINLLADPFPRAGSFPILLNGGLDDNYLIELENGNLTVDKKDLVVKPRDATVTYGDIEAGISITININFEGFVFDDDVFDLDGSIEHTINIASGNNVGQYPIILTAPPDDNYELILESGILNIVKKELIVTADDAQVEYGDPISTLSVSYEGFVKNENESVLEEEPIAETPATQFDTVDEYPISVVGGDDNNYEFVRREGILEISKAELSAIADDVSMFFGQNVPDLTVSYEGFKGADSPSDLNEEPIISSEVQPFDDAGVYAVSIEGGIDDNYDFVYFNGELTVDKAVIEVQPNSIFSTYGDVIEVPNEPFEYSGFVNGNDLNDIDVLPNLILTENELSPAGSYTIIGSGASDNNYQFEYIEGELLISKASLVVEANDITVNQRDEFPEFSVTYSGFVNGDTENVIDESPVVIPDIADTSIPGIYDLNLSGGADNNYSFSFVSGVIEIVETPLNIDEPSRLFVYPNPTKGAITIKNGAYDHVEIIDVSGKLIVSKIKENKIDLSDLKSGTYLLRLINSKSSNQARQIRIVKD